MTVSENRYMESVPKQLREIAKSLEASRPRFVKMQDKSGRTHYFNAAKVSEVCEDEKDGCVYIVFDGPEHYFKFAGTAAEALSAFGMA